MSLRRIKLKPLLYPKCKIRSYFTHISNLQQKRISNHLWAEYDWRDGKGEKHKSFKGEQ